MPPCTASMVMEASSCREEVKHSTSLECLGQSCDKHEDFKRPIDTCPECWSLSSPLDMSAMARWYTALLDASVTNMRRPTSDVMTTG